MFQFVIKNILFVQRLKISLFCFHAQEIGIETVAFKGQVAVTIMQVLIALLLWILCIVAGCVSCCCAPTIDQVSVHSSLLTSIQFSAIKKEKIILEGDEILCGIENLWFAREQVKRFQKLSLKTLNHFPSR